MSGVSNVLHSSDFTLPNSVLARCSVTTFLLPTPYVRTCVGCGRKALLSNSVLLDEEVEDPWRPGGAQNWIVEELLQAIQACLYCGQQFIRLL